MRRLLILMAILVAATACGDSGSTTTGAELVVEREIPDPALDQIAVAASGLIPTPSGYEQISIIEDARPIASFVIFVPEPFDNFWKVGQEPEDWLRPVLERDPEFGAVIAGDLRNSAPLDNRRLVTYDTSAPSDALALVQVQLSAPEVLLTADELIAAYTGSASASGATGVFGEKLPWHGLEVAYVGARVPASVTGLSGDRYEIITYYFDTTNQVQWSLGCDIPADLFDEYQGPCQIMGLSFVPLSMWNDLDLAQAPAE